jgi:hypothetical protein
MLRLVLHSAVAILLLAPALAGQSPSGEDAGPLPVRDWIREGEQKDFDWNLTIPRPDLRMDQRFEIALSARVEAGKLREADRDHELTFMTVVTDRDRAWLGASEPEHKTLDRDLDEESAVEFESYVSLVPGRYIIWVVLYDATTGQRNIGRRETEVDTIRNDPLPKIYADFPAVDFAHLEYISTLRVRQYSSDLSVPVASGRPLDVELIATLSAPEQWPDGGAVARHTENILGGMTALGELDLASGSVWVTGLDLLRREIAFPRQEARTVDRLELVETFENVNRSAISLEALVDRSENPAFLRQYLEDRMSEESADDAVQAPMKIFILIAGVMRFEDHPDLSPISLEGPCDCRVYHLRFKQRPQDLFDQVDDILETLDPPTYDIVTARDFRKALGKIVEDLDGF